MNTPCGEQWREPAQEPDRYANGSGAAPPPCPSPARRRKTRLCREGAGEDQLTLALLAFASLVAPFTGLLVSAGLPGFDTFAVFTWLVCLVVFAWAVCLPCLAMAS